jgi:hypothetical protein
VEHANIKVGSQIYGNDAINPPDWPSSVCTGSTIRHLPGVRAPDSSAVQISGTSLVSGYPSVLVDPSVGLWTIATPGGVEFKTLRLEATHTFSSFDGTPAPGACDPTNTSNWGAPNDPTGPCGDYFPIIHVGGSAVLNPGTRAQGILLVEGDLSILGNVDFYGMIVVLGNLTAEGDAIRIRGTVYANDAILNSSTNPLIYNTSCVMDRVRAAHPELGSGVHPVSSRSWLDLSGMD